MKNILSVPWEPGPVLTLVSLSSLEGGAHSGLHGGGAALGTDSMLLGAAMALTTPSPSECFIINRVF